MAERLRYATWRPGRSAFRGFAWIGGAVAWAFAAALGAVLALFFTIAMVLALMMAAAVMTLVAAAVRASRAIRPRAAPEIIEARHMGGHSWVAYGWDGRR